jgi:hypothetical protein
LNKFFLIFCILFSINFCAQKKKAKEPLPIPKWKIQGRFAFIFNQSSFTNWVSGGENTVAGNINVNYDINHKNKNLNWDTRVISGYGLSHLSAKGYRKTDDRFELNSLLGIKSKDLWFFSFFTNFKTQYTEGYNYKIEPKSLVSNFFSPAYLSFGPGMLWKKSDNLNVNIAPATSRFTFVNDKFSGKFGVEEGDNSVFSLGFNLTGYTKFSLMENIEMENIIALYSDYLEKPQNIDLDYQSNIRFKVNKFIKMQMTFHTIIDDNSSGKVQFRQLFGMGLNYDFHEKVTY